MLQSHTLQFAYNNQTQFQFPDLDCPKGTALLILGESGKGKTTLLHLLAGLLRPSSGTIQIDGTDLTHLTIKELDQFRGKHIGIVFQQSHFIKSLSVKKNLLMAQYLAALPQSTKRVEELLQRLNIANKMNHRPQELSQGEQQRVAIARALINRPKVILADEPTASLDDKNCFKVLKLLEEQADAVQASLIIVTHDARLKQHFSNQIALGDS